MPFTNPVINEMLTSEETYFCTLDQLEKTYHVDTLAKDILKPFMVTLLAFKDISGRLISNANHILEHDLDEEAGQASQASQARQQERIQLLSLFYMTYEQYMTIYEEQAKKFQTSLIYGEKFKQINQSLITCIQRGVRYELLMKEALKQSVGLNDETKRELDESLKIVKQLMAAINDDATETIEPYHFGMYTIGALKEIKKNMDQSGYYPGKFTLTGVQYVSTLFRGRGAAAAEEPRPSSSDKLPIR